MKRTTKSILAVAAIVITSSIFVSSISAQAENSELHQRGLIQFQPGATSAQINHFLTSHNVDRYTFQASAGQNAVLDLKSSDRSVLLTIIDPEGSPVVRYEGGVFQWSGTLPHSGTYTVDAVNVNADTNYTLVLSIR